MTIMNETEGYFGVGKQSVQGTGVVPAKFAKYIDMAIDHGMGKLDIKDEGGGSTTPAYVSQTIKTEHKPNGSLKFYARPSIFPLLLAYFLGKDTISGVIDPYTHTLTPLRPLPWLSFERRIGADATQQVIERIIDSRINEMTIDFESGKPVSGSLTAFGIEMGWQASPQSDAYDSGDIFVFTEGVFTLDNLASDGTAASRITKGSIKMTNSIDDKVMGGPTVKRLGLPPAHLLVDLSLTTFLELEATDKFFRKINYGAAAGTAISNTFYSQITNAFKVIFTITGSSPVRSLEIQIPKAYYTVGNVKQAGSGAAIKMDIEASGAKGTGEIITIIGKNADTTAYV